MPVRKKDQICKPVFMKNGHIKASKSKQTFPTLKQLTKPSNANQILKNRTIMTTPTSDIQQTLGIYRSISSSYSPYEYKPIDDLPSLNSVSEDKFDELLKNKLKQCCKICNFSNMMADLKSKNLKLKYLKEIRDCLSSSNSNKFIEPEILDEFFKMLKCNMFRAMPPIPEIVKMPMISNDNNDKTYESSWQHLEIVYQIFQEFLDSNLMNSTQIVEKIDSKFIHQFLMAFNSSDERERNALKMILHKMYLKFVQQRVMIRKAIHHILYTYLYEIKYFCGINELLEIIHSIINGYFVPLKQEHKNFLINLLLPLYTSNHLYSFQNTLLNCVLQYIKKDHQLISVIICKLLTFWPVSSTMKEICFLNHIGKYLDLISDTQFTYIMEPLLHRIGKCITSKNFQICETAILLWKSDKFIEMTIVHSDVLFPIICPYLYKTGTNHWNISIKNLAVSVIRIFMELSRDVFESFSRSMKLQEQQNNQKLADEKRKWLMIMNSADSNDNCLNLIEKMNELNVIFPELHKTKI